MEFNVFAYVFFGLLIVILKLIIVSPKVFSLNPFDNFFLINISVYFSTVFFVYTEIENYFHLLNYILICATTLVMGAFFSKTIFRFTKIDEILYSKKQFIDDLPRRKIRFITVIIIFSTIVSLIVINNQGGIVPLIAIQTFLVDGQEEAAKMYIDSRINISHGKTYFAPGFVAQLKDYIVPYLCLVLFFKYTITQNKFIKKIFIVSLVLSIIGLLSSGTRSGLIIFLFSFLLSISSNLIGFKLFSRIKAIRIGIISFVLMSGLTFLMGRTSESSSGVLSIIIDGGSKIIERISAITARENIIIYDNFLINAETDLLHDWLLTLSTFLPGQQIPMSIYFAKLVGYSSGNVPLHYWTGLLYNFGPIGFVISFLWGGALQFFYIYILKKRKTILNYAAFSLASIYLGFAIDPAGLLLYGFFTTIMLNLIIKFLPNNNSSR
jgi:hypothetical protein